MVGRLRNFEQILVKKAGRGWHHRCRTRRPFVVSPQGSCACRKSNPNILVVQPAQDRAAKNGPGQFDGARDRRILLQR